MIRVRLGIPRRLLKVSANYDTHCNDIQDNSNRCNSRPTLSKMTASMITLSIMTLQNDTIGIGAAI